MRIVHREARVTVAVAVGMLLCAVLPTAAAADTVSYQVAETTPMALATTNPCTGEPVTLTGTYHFTSDYSVTTDLSGTRFHSVEIKKLSLSGTTPIGTRYQNEEQQTSEQNGTFTFDTGSLAPYERTDESTMLMIRQGETQTSDDDFWVKFIAHVTYNANGTTTISGATLNVFCR